MKIKLISGIILFFSTTMSVVAQQSIDFKVSFIEPQAHYAEVEMNIQGVEKDYIDIKMPVWTPGSYLVREYSKSVEDLKAKSNGTELKVEKVRKNIWRLYTKNAKQVKVNYRVYAFEVSVRTPFVDASHAFLSPTGIFMYPDGMINSPSTVSIEPFHTWSKVSTGLEPVAGKKFTYYAKNFDVLFDSPIEVGNQDIFEFTAAGVKHEVAMYGGGNYDKEKLKVDMAKIVEGGTAIFGENPNKYYVFIVHNFRQGGGGLEHANSTVLGATRTAYASPQGYKSFLALVAHEYFHLWNVKRLRPVALGPFDYDNEVYTTNLWIAEGFTTYYATKLLLRSKVTDENGFVKDLLGGLGTVMNTPGSRYQSAAQASFDAWIISYRPNENSNNISISYYGKGEVIGMFMDLEIARATKGKKSLDDVMRAMYDQVAQQGRGYTDAEFKAMLEKISGVDFTDFYAKYVNGTIEPEFEKYFAYAGIKVENLLSNDNTPSIGARVQLNNNPGLTVTNVLRNSAAWVDGLNVNDQILSINGIDTKEWLKNLPANSRMVNLDALLEVPAKKVGDKIVMQVMRDGIELPLSLTLKSQKTFRFSHQIDPNATKEQKAVFKAWTGLK